MLEKANAVINRKVAGNIEEVITVNGYHSIMSGIEILLNSDWYKDEYKTKRKLFNKRMKVFFNDENSKK